MRAVTVLNLGRHFPVPREHWPALCARLEELMHGQAALLPLDGPPSVEAAAQRYAALLLARWGERRAVPATGAEATGTALGTDVQAVDIDALELTRPRSVGVEQVALWRANASAGTEVRAWAVVRDNRNGVSWTWQDVWVE